MPLRALGVARVNARQYPYLQVKSTTDSSVTSSIDSKCENHSIHPRQGASVDS